MPKRFFVTRHHGAIKWATKHQLRARKIEMKHFDPDVLRPGDVVMGTLPIHLVAEVNRRGGSYWHLAMDVPPESRGAELSAEDMDACGARLFEYRVIPVAARTEHGRGPEVWGTHAEASDRPALHLCIATGQQLPNAAPIRLTSWDRVVIFASRKMRPAADRLAAFVADEAERRDLRPEQGKPLIIDLPAEDDLLAIRDAVVRAVDRLRESFPEHELVLNITGGTKLMTLGFVEALRGQAKMLYCDSGCGVLQAVDPPGAAPQELGPQLDFETLLRVNGWRVVEGGVPAPEQVAAMIARRHVTALLALRLPDAAYRLRARLEGEDYACNGLAALLHHAGHRASEHGVLTQRARRETGKGDIDAAAIEIVRLLQQAGVLAEGTSVQAGAEELCFVFASREAGSFVASRFMEEFVWLSAQAAGLQAHYIGLGAHFDPLQALEGRRSDKLNEIDVGIAWNARLLTIECKAGNSWSFPPNDQRALQKAAAVRTAAGGSLAESWLASDLRTIPARAADVQERANMTQVKLHLGTQALARLPRAIAAWAGLPTPSFDWTSEVPALGRKERPGHGKRQR